ncbi:hypothetical protein F3Y22_tig00008256pilonHSYRG00023 [Hibiscus syriacus]|uniref:Uncharacterized protein n=1 Tax=Hibiscus syriacus TaxID=106335 RepID=A0A6A3CEP7_HIBSY|nr:hypothetical protein F3Y22_tig00008256pilonHSYRG00023 [Hibiscus syriacus]
MVEMADAHIVKIPVDEEQPRKLSRALATVTTILSHPLISESRPSLASQVVAKRGRRHRSSNSVASLLSSMAFSSSCSHLPKITFAGNCGERNDNRGLTRCIQEPRMKGESFDLSKEPHVGKRMKSTSVEIKWKGVTWWSQYLITTVLFASRSLWLSLEDYSQIRFDVPIGDEASWSDNTENMSRQHHYSVAEAIV